MASLDRSLEHGVLVEPRRPVAFGRDLARAEDGTVVVQVPMLIHDRTPSQAVSKLAGTVWLDPTGRPILSNHSRVHDLYLRRWPHSLSEKVAKKESEHQADPHQKMLTEGWWWVSTSRGSTPGWILISVETVRQRRRAQVPNGRPGPPVHSEQTLTPDARPTYSLPDELVDLFVNYFIDWFAVPPAVSPRLRTGPEVSDNGDNGRNRILTALKVEIPKPTGRRGLLNPNLLIRAIDEGKLTFRSVYDILPQEN